MCRLRQIALEATQFEVCRTLPQTPLIPTYALRSLRLPPLRYFETLGRRSLHRGLASGEAFSRTPKLGVLPPCIMFFSGFKTSSGQIVASEGLASCSFWGVWTLGRNRKDDWHKSSEEALLGPRAWDLAVFSMCFLGPDRRTQMSGSTPRRARTIRKIAPHHASRSVFGKRCRLGLGVSLLSWEAFHKGRLHHTTAAWRT